MISGAERELTVHVSAGRGCARLPVLRRAVAATSARAGLPLDRIDDALLILESLLTDRRAAVADELELVMTARPGSLELLVGPLAGGEAERVLESELPIVGQVIARLASDAVALDGGSHLLILVDAA